MRRATFLWRYASNHVGAIRDGLLAVKGTLRACEPLADDAGILAQLHVGNCAHEAAVGRMLDSTPGKIAERTHSATTIQEPEFSRQSTCIEGGLNKAVLHARVAFKSSFLSRVRISSSGNSHDCCENLVDCCQMQRMLLLGRPERIPVYFDEEHCLPETSPPKKVRQNRSCPPHLKQADMGIVVGMFLAS